MFKDRAVKIIRSIRVGRISKIILLLIFCISIFGIFGQTKADTISDKQAELDSLQQQINDYSTIIAQKQKEAGSLQAQIGAIDASLEKTKLEIQRTQANIDKNQLEIDDTQAKINDKQKEMDKKKQILKACIQTTYEQGKQSTLEMLVSSDNLSDYMDQVEYVSVVEDKTKGIFDEVKKIKEQLTAYRKDLEGKKNELANLKNQKETEQNNLEGQIATKQSLLAQTQGEEATYQNLLSSAKTQSQQAYNEIAAIVNPPSRGVIPRGGGGGCGGGYPYCGLQGVDPWGFYMGQCTSYAAWKRYAVGRPIPAWGSMGGCADARTWPSWARRSGLTVNGNPTPGCIVVFPYLSQWGHVAYVEGVGSGMIYFSDYNGWGGCESYGEGSAPISAYGAVYIH